MKKLTALVTISALLMCCASASAQSCVSGYARGERRAVLSSYKAPEQILSRMAVLAELSADGAYSQAQRQALYNEFDALRTYLGVLGSSARPWLSTTAQSFLATVIEPGYLNLNGLTFLGATIPESQQLSRLALDAVNISLSDLEICLSGAWEQVPLVGSPNTGNCGGGYLASERRAVRYLASRARNVLQDLKRKALVAVNQPAVSLSERTLRQQDFSYRREDLEIISADFYPLLQSANFVATVMDPVYLDIATATVDGPTVAQAQVNAGLALSRINTAINTLNGCVQ
jgi:hypothetical protein